jgi:hypothetical protein
MEGAVVRIPDIPRCFTNWRRVKVERKRKGKVTPRQQLTK